MIKEFVIKKSDDFHGIPHTILEDGIDVCSGNPRKSYETDEYEIIPEDVFEKKLESFCSDVCGKWEETTEERYNDMLDILPPLKWTRGGFFVSEAYTLNIYPFHQKLDGRFYQAMFRINTPRDQILKSLEEFINQKEQGNG